MNISSILKDLRSERARIDQAIAAIESLDISSTSTRTQAVVASSTDRKAKRMSAAARRKISAAAKARWAERKGKASAAAPKKVGRRGLTPAGRKRLSENMKKRWAAKRAASKA